VFNWFNSEGDREIGPFFCALFFSAYGKIHWGSSGSPIRRGLFFLEISGNHFLFCIEVSTLAM
jgi:hypothetical protein